MNVELCRIKQQNIDIFRLQMNSVTY